MMCEFEEELLSKLTNKERGLLKNIHKYFLPEEVIQTLISTEDTSCLRHQINKTIQNYKFFIFLSYCISARIAPSKDVCILWKYHSQTKEYLSFCSKYLNDLSFQYIPYYTLPKSGLKKVSKETNNNIYTEFSVFTCPNNIVMFVENKGL